MINILYISTVDYKWNDSTLTPINRHNVRSIIDRANLVDCCTSVEDLYCENIDYACQNANKIVCVNIDQNIKTDNNNFFSYGRLFNNLRRYKNKVSNFEYTKNFNSVVQQRYNDDPVLWTAGCSVTVGTGLETPEQRWGSQLSNKLELPEVSLSKNGTSIPWAADQLLRSDLRPGDIVVWGLTNPQRIVIGKNWTLYPTTIISYIDLINDYRYWNLDYFASQTLVLNNLMSILQVINFCKKLDVQLYLANILDISWLAVMLDQFDNFIDLTENLQIDNNNISFIDYGTDNCHPGPRQHHQYATQIFNFIEESKHGKTI